MLDVVAFNGGKSRRGAPGCKEGWVSLGRLHSGAFPMSLTLLVPCSSVLKAELRSGEQFVIGCTYQKLFKVICFVDIYNDEDEPQHFWSADIDFVMASQCSTAPPIITNNLPFHQICGLPLHFPEFCSLQRGLYQGPERAGLLLQGG